MESGSLHEEDAPHQEETMEGRDEAAAEEVEADPRGFHELAFLGKSNAAEAELELEERDIGPEFDSYEDLAGDKLRLLDRWGVVGAWDDGARSEEGLRCVALFSCAFFCS